jgi:hypothetical protein
MTLAGLVAKNALRNKLRSLPTILSIAFSIWLLTIMRAGAIVENALAKQHGWKPGDRIVIQGKFFPVNLELNIRGIYKPAVPARGIWFN